MMASFTPDITGLPKTGYGIIVLYPYIIDKTKQNGAQEVFYTDGERYWRKAVNDSITPWFRVATATPTQEYNIPFQSGWHAAAKTTYCKTQEEVCVVNCSASGSGVASSNFIATLPAGFRPSTTVCAAAHVYKNGVRGIAEVHIGSGGDIVVYSPIEFDSVSFGVSFVVAI